MKLFDLILPYILALFLLANCNNPETVQETTDRAQEIVDLSMAAHNGHALDRAELSFKFRVRNYIYKKFDGAFEYTRIFKDTTGSTTIDVLSNDGLVRTIDNVNQELDSTWNSRYSNSINSVIYFAFLPYRLNDGAVIKKYNGQIEITGKSYHEVLVQFREEGGGKDHDDNFLYWINTESHMLDYFAYDYVVDGGGVRFREAINRRTINGITIQDYVNYKPSSDSQELADMAEAFNAGELTELSRIELANVEVRHLTEAF